MDGFSEFTEKDKQKKEKPPSHECLVSRKTVDVSEGVVSFGAVMDRGVWVEKRREIRGKTATPIRRVPE